jgi:hypothetical protein
MSVEDYAQAAHMSHASLHERMSRVLSIANVASFNVTLRRDGLELPFHGLCNLTGDASLAVLPAACPGAGISAGMPAAVAAGAPHSASGTGEPLS